jgi:hypothetical protein
MLWKLYGALMPTCTPKTELGFAAQARAAGNAATASLPIARLV